MREDVLGELLHRLGERVHVGDVDAVGAPEVDHVAQSGHEVLELGFFGGRHSGNECVGRVEFLGNELAITDLGKFGTAQRAAKTGRNPKTGEAIQIAAKRAPKFSPAKALKDAAAA